SHSVLRFKYTLNFSNGYTHIHLGINFRMFSKSDLVQVNSHRKEIDFFIHNLQCEAFTLPMYIGNFIQPSAQGTLQNRVMQNRTGKIEKQKGKMKRHLTPRFVQDSALYLAPQSYN